MQLEAVETGAVHAPRAGSGGGIDFASRRSFGEAA